MQQVKPKKGLGQHFLTDKNIARKIVDSIIPGDYHSLIEIGPGTGILTKLILENQEPDFTAVELDRESLFWAIFFNILLKSILSRLHL